MTIKWNLESGAGVRAERCGLELWKCGGRDGVG